MNKIFIFIKRRRILTICIIAVIAIAVFFLVKKTNNSQVSVEYTTQAVEKGILISSVDGSGQVSASNQVEIQAKVSGDIVAVSVQNGQEVKKDDLIATVDTRDAARQVNEARESYNTALLELEELLAPTDSYTLLQAQNSLEDAKDSLVKLKISQENEYQTGLDNLEQAKEDLESDYADSYNAISNAFLDFPTVITALNNVLFSYEITDNNSSIISNQNSSVLNNYFPDDDYEEKLKFEQIIEDAEDYYWLAKESYNENFDNYKDSDRYSEEEVIEELLDETIETSKKISDAIKKQINMLDYWVEAMEADDKNIFSEVTSYQSNLNSYTSKTHSHLSTLSSYKNSLTDDKEKIEDLEREIEEMEETHPLNLKSSERSLKEKEEKLADLEAGADELEIRNQRITIQQKYNSLLEAQQDLEDHYIRAPFDGSIAELNVAIGDTISNSTAVVTLIANQRIAEITLNEIDAVSVKTGQRVNLTFDAIEDLEITGQVTEVDTLGEVNQGVVSYGVTILFDVQDERIKPGMSVSTSIIIEAKPNVLMIPITAVKTSGNNSYVEILTDGQVSRKTVITGSSNDTMIEITDGLEEGEEIITQTISSTSSSSSSSSQGGPGGMGMMGMMR